MRILRTDGEIDAASIQSEPQFSLGIELELQLVNPHGFDLTRGAASLLAALARSSRAGSVKPEITESMIEVNTRVHSRYGDLLDDLAEVCAQVSAAAARLNLGVAGGGAHPFHRWSDRRIYPTGRFSRLSELYGYLAKQFTVFGQHIHIGCSSGDEAVHLAHRLAYFVPHLIVLSAASPFAQGEDTAFCTSRLHHVSAFPLSGHMPLVTSWAEFEGYFAAMANFGIVQSMKDFYWDIRPKPEFGTIEIRVCDTPLQIDTAAALGGFVQALCAFLVQQAPAIPSADAYLVYDYNRFQACRFGYDAEIIDLTTRQPVGLRDDILSILNKVRAHAERLDGEAAIETLHRQAVISSNGAAIMRAAFDKHASLPDVVREMCALWDGSDRFLT